MTAQPPLHSFLPHQVRLKEVPPTHTMLLQGKKFPPIQNSLPAGAPAITVKAAIDLVPM